MRTYIHTYIHTYVHTYIHTSLRTYIYLYIHTYKHIYIYKYIHTYIVHNTYTYKQLDKETDIYQCNHTFIHCIHTYTVIYKHTHTHTHIHTSIQLTIISRTQVGYDVLDSGRGVDHQVGYHKLISNKREWNNCFIKHKTLK